MSVSLPPVTPPGTRHPLLLATPPAGRQISTTPPASGRPSVPQMSSSSARRPSQSVPQAAHPPSNHAPLSQTSSSTASVATGANIPPPSQTSSLSFKSQQPPASDGPDSGPGETTTLLSEQQNCMGSRRPSQTQAHPHLHTIGHVHTESTI